MASVFVTVGIWDYRTQRIPNAIIYPAMLLASSYAVWQGLYWNFAAGVGMMLLFLLASRIFVVGFGDVKYALLIGLVVGWPYALYAVLVTAVTGIVTAVVMLNKGKTPHELYPYGVFLSAGAIVATGVLSFCLSFSA